MSSTEVSDSQFTLLHAEHHKPIKAWIKGVPLEDEARAQLINIASLPFVGPWVAVMPDVHLGKGATVGSVVPTRGAIIPAAVGVDIGCGMAAIQTTLKAKDLPESLAARFRAGSCWCRNSSPAWWCRFCRSMCFSPSPISGRSNRQ